MQRSYDSLCSGCGCHVAAAGACPLCLPAVLPGASNDKPCSSLTCASRADVHWLAVVHTLGAGRAGVAEPARRECMVALRHR